MTAQIKVGRTTRDEVRVTINGRMHILTTQEAHELAEGISNIIYKINDDQEQWARTIRQEHSS